MLWVAYGLMGVLLAGYLVSLIVRGEDQTWPLFSDWSAAGFEGFGAILCLVRGLTRRSGRAVALTLGFGLLMWSVGDFVLTFESEPEALHEATRVLAITDGVMRHMAVARPQRAKRPEAPAEPEPAESTA